MFVLDLLHIVFLLYSIPTFICFAWNFYVNGKVLSDKGKSKSIFICLLSVILLFVDFCLIVYNDEVIKETNKCHYYMTRIQMALNSYENLPSEKKIDSDNNNRRQNRFIQVFTPDQVNDYLNLVKELEKNKLLDNKELNKNKKCLYGVEYINETIDIYCNKHGSLKKESNKFFYNEKKRGIEKIRNIYNIVLFLFTICIVIFVLNGNKFTGGKYKSFVMYDDGNMGLNGNNKRYKSSKEVKKDFIEAILKNLSNDDDK